MQTCTTPLTSRITNDDRRLHESPTSPLNHRLTDWPSDLPAIGSFGPDDNLNRQAKQSWRERGRQLK